MSYQGSDACRRSRTGNEAQTACGTGKGVKRVTKRPSASGGTGRTERESAHGPWRVASGHQYSFTDDSV